MRRTHGFTLLEALIALAIFGLVAVMATVGVSGALRAQTLNEAVVSSQSRLRRVNEVFTQELRSAVLGSVTNTPYVSNDHQVSFITLTGGSGDPVLPHDYGKNKSFQTADNLDLLWSHANTSATTLEGHHLLIVNANGEAAVFKVTNVQAIGTDPYHYNVVHAGCANTIAYTGSQTMTMRARTIGFRYDAASQTLYMTEGSSPEVPLAFDLTGVTMQYVYQTTSGTTVVRSTPLTDSAGAPLRQGTIGGESATLVRIGLAVSSRSGPQGRTVSRTVGSEVEMTSRHSFAINQVTTCN